MSTRKIAPTPMRKSARERRSILNNRQDHPKPVIGLSHATTHTTTVFNHTTQFRSSAPASRVDTATAPNWEQVRKASTSARKTTIEIKTIDFAVWRSFRNATGLEVAYHVVRARSRFRPTNREKNMHAFVATFAVCEEYRSILGFLLRIAWHKCLPFAPRRFKLPAHDKWQSIE